LVTKQDKYVLPWVAGRFILCPYVRVIYEQIWEPQEVCNGPVRSVLGLAPGESIITEVRHVEQVDYTRIVRSGFESTETTSFMRPTDEVAAAGSGSATKPDLPHIRWGMFGSIYFTPRLVNSWNLNLGGIIGAAVGAVAGGPIGAAVGAFLGDAVGDWVGGGSGSSQTADGIDQSLASVTRTQTQYNATETSRTESTLTERTVSRSFSNPYRDRSLDLRFIPVFRHYTVTTRILRFEFGLSCAAVEAKFDPNLIAAKLGGILDERIFDPRIRAIVEQDLGETPKLPLWSTVGSKRQALIAEHFNANPDHYSRAVLANAFRRGTPAGVLKHGISAIAGAVGDGDPVPVLESLDYNASYVVDNCVFLPVPEIEKFQRWPGFDPAILEKLKQVPPYLPPGRPVLPAPIVREVHIYIGTRIEPAAGQCVLQNLP
jgi:hypothetical protein